MIEIDLASKPRGKPLLTLAYILGNFKMPGGRADPRLPGAPPKLRGGNQRPCVSRTCVVAPFIHLGNQPRRNETRAEKAGGAHPPVRQIWFIGEAYARGS